MLREARPKTSRGVRLQCRHFFSGTALYANGTICASLTPVGFAVKLSQESRAALLRERRGKPLRYFEEGPIKKGVRSSLGRHAFRASGNPGILAAEHSVRYTRQAVA